VKAEASRRPGEGVEKSARADSEREPNRELTDAEVKLQGTWQAYDYSAQTKTWLMRFDGRHFRAQAGEDDWYEGRIEIREGDGPAQIDFAIEECRCSYKGMTSEAIYRWDGDSLVVAAPRPGAPRPPRFVEMSGQMMRLQPVASSVGQ
jgi:uncharacterized protein (TIGR03067 family)